MPSTIDRLAQGVAQLFKVLAAINSADGGPRKLLASVGFDMPPGVDDIGLAAVDLSAAIQSVDQLEAAIAGGADDATIAGRFADVLIALGQAFADLRAAIAGLSIAGDYLDKTQIKSELLPRLQSLFTASRIGGAAPLALLVLQLFGIVTLKPFAADPTIFQVEHVRVVFDWKALPRLFSDPVGLLRARYGWGTAAFDGDSLVANLSALIQAIGEPARVRALPRRVEEQLVGRAVPEADAAPTTQLVVSFARGDATSGLDAGFSFFPLRPSAAGATDAGVALNPFVHGFTDLSFPLAPRTTLELESTMALDSGVVLSFRAGKPASLKAGLLGRGGIVDGATGKAVVHVKYAAPAGGPQTLLELPGGGVVEIDALTFTGGIEVLDGTLSPSFGLAVKGGHAALRSDGADSFVADVLPAGGLDLHFDVGLRWSAAQGFHFEGSASGEIDLPLHLSIAGLEIDRLHVGIRPSDAGLALEISVGAAAHIGPVAAVLDRVGALASLAFRDGNLGPIDASLAFQPPAGVGLSVDAAGVVSGGGFLYHDATLGLYAGAMQLSLHEQLTLKAFGLITTRLPDGARGYSLLVFITAEDFRPIPLGLGFNLLGIGGMVGVHRTFDEDALRRGLKDGSLAALLFPRDPVGNASSLMRGLDSAFPARRGSYLLGLLAKIGWFTPTLVLFDLALILEFGGRKRLLALGSISARLPSADNDLVRLNMEALGVIDFDAGTIAIDAQLVDSRLAHKFPILGSAALRANVGSGPGFVLAVGGLNPHFTPPAGLPALDRVSIALSSGDNPRLICDAYFAITSNTVQFGARASLYASAAGFSVQGDVGFDVLVQIAPLHFIADFHASVQLKRGSHNLFMVSVDGELEGPRPLRVSGKASFEILWCDFSVHFDTTLVQGEPPPLPPAVDVLAALVAALASPSSWTTQRGSAPPHGVALKSLPPAAATAPLVLDPLGRIVVKQEVVPLDTGRDIDTFGGAPVAGARRFVLGATLNGTPLASQPLQSPFAPAQFFVMSDDDKLAAPSFEPMDAGATFGSAATVFDPAQTIAAPLEYRTIVIQKTGAAPPVSPPSGYSVDAAHLVASSATGAAARSPLRQVGTARFRNAAVAPGATLPARRWTIMPLGDGGPASVAASVRTFSEYDAALKAMNRAGARWQLLPSFEIGG